MQDGIEIIYDGECPLCRSWIGMVRLRKAVGQVVLIDARGDDPRLPALMANHDLDRGMLVRFGGRIWHGAAAMQLLSILSERAGPLQLWMRNPRRAALTYPVLVLGRRVLLAVLGRKGLG